MIDPWKNIDSYCERLDVTLLSEPLNLCSNIGFIVAAWMVQRDSQTLPPAQRASIKRLYGLIYCIGIGSSLFHSFANLVTMALDVLPISLYIIYFLGHWNTTLMGYSPKKSASILGLWLLLTLVLSFGLKSLPLAGSQTYLSVALFLPWMAYQQKAIFSASSTYKSFEYPQDLTLASIIFIASLLFRTIDPFICPLWQYGTHFLWHLLNSILLFLTASNSIKIQNLKK